MPTDTTTTETAVRYDARSVMKAITTFENAVRENNLSAFSESCKAGEAAWSAVAPIYDEAFANYKSSHPTATVMSASQFNLVLATSFGKGWKVTDRQLSQVMAFRVHSAKTKANYTKLVSRVATERGTSAEVTFSGYVRHLNLIAKGRLTEAMELAENVATVEREREAEAKRMKGVTVTDRDFTTLIPASIQDAPGKLAELLKLKNDLDVQIAAMIETMEASDVYAARKSATTTLRLAAGLPAEAPKVKR